MFYLLKVTTCEITTGIQFSFAVSFPMILLWWFSTGSGFAPQGTCSNVWRHFFCHSLGGEYVGRGWGCCLNIPHVQDSVQRKKNHPPPNVNSSEVEKPCFTSLSLCFIYASFSRQMDFSYLL